jgi:hypothetical protein
MNVTVPLGVPVPGADTVTVAVKVTDCPNVDGLTDETTAVEVPALFTVWVNTGDVLPLKLALPEYCAVIECAPTDSVEIAAEVALPELPFVVTVPSDVAPSKKVTVPCGRVLPIWPVIVAVNVTDWPKTDGFTDAVTVTVVGTAVMSNALLVALATPPDVATRV